MNKNQIKTEKQAISVLIGCGIPLDMKRKIQYWTFGVKPTDKQIAAGKFLDSIFEEKTDIAVGTIDASGAEHKPLTSNSTRVWSTVWCHGVSCNCKSCIKGESTKVIRSVNPSGATYKLMHGKKFAGVVHKSVKSTPSLSFL